ncbi:four helix bundle protein [Persicirhabdus sediminis]|uniref:Four helix bundle protein n=1 Tax=Persicirhabdus sediminis TaxID=454144 RepID=A0A8J7SKU6_9BACT|nr:four helix bundle protein [Persicirhabdus sediminis]MBK1789993.1 four helix bundle protein [Persicirhabdus sediminis]
MAFHSFEDLEVWKRSCRLSLKVMEQTQNSNNYALKDQMIRSAISVPSNIAEGQERDSQGDFIRFLRIAKGSCGELRTQLYLAYKSSMIPEQPALDMIKETKEISSMLQGLIRSIQGA